LLYLTAFQCKLRTTTAFVPYKPVVAAWNKIVTVQSSSSAEVRGLYSWNSQLPHELKLPVQTWVCTTSKSASRTLQRQLFYSTWWTGITV